jgi:hypothetical protein
MFVGAVTRILLLICILPQHVAQNPIGEQLHMHVILRTYSGQATTLAGTLSSIFAAASKAPWLRVSLAILDTGDQDHQLVAMTVRRIVKTLTSVWSKAAGEAPRVHLRRPLEEGASTYGYVASDRELDRVLGRSASRATEYAKHSPDYVLFCNGDTFYGSELFEAARSFMQGGHGLIGMPWVPHPGHADGEAVMKKYKRCEFVHGGIDLNSVFISVAALERSQASFAKLPTPCAGPTLAESTPGCRGIDARPYWVADYGLIYQVLAGGARATCLDTRPLFLQN